APRTHHGRNCVCTLAAIPECILIPSHTRGSFNFISASSEEQISSASKFGDQVGTRGNILCGPPEQRCDNEHLFMSKLKPQKNRFEEQLLSRCFKSDSFLELQSCDLNQTGEFWLSRPALGLVRTKSLLHWVPVVWVRCIGLAIPAWSARSQSKS